MLNHDTCRVLLRLFQTEEINVPVTVLPTETGFDFRVIAHEPPEVVPDTPQTTAIAQPLTSTITAASALAMVSTFVN